MLNFPAQALPVPKAWHRLATNVAEPTLTNLASLALLTSNYLMKLLFTSLHGRLRSPIFTGTGLDADRST